MVLLIRVEGSNIFVFNYLLANCQIGVCSLCCPDVGGSISKRDFWTTESASVSVLFRDDDRPAGLLQLLLLKLYCDYCLLLYIPLQGNNTGSRVSAKSEKWPVDDGRRSIFRSDRRDSRPSTTVSTTSSLTLSPDRVP